MRRRLPLRLRRVERRPHEAERAPRIVLRFATVTALCLGAATAGILLFTRHLNLQAAQREAARHATFVAKTILTGEIAPADVAAPVTGARRAVLDERLRRLLGSQGTDANGVNGIIPTLAISLAGDDGRITYSTDHLLIGRRLVPAARLHDAMRGFTSSAISTTRRGETSDGLPHKALDAYVPFRPGGRGRAIAVVALDYRAIGAAASSSFYPIAGILELALVVLYAVFVPLLVRVSRRLRRQVEHIRHQAYHDELTGLANRLSFRERTAELVARRQGGEELALLIVDLDRFKEINDTLGHQAGDALLVQLADRLRERLPAEVLLARLGGDELGLVLGGNECEARTVAGIVEATLREDFVVGGIPVGVEASIGVALCPEHGTAVDILMARADVAMYQAKARRSGTVLYERSFEESRQVQVTLLGELRRALDEGEIVLHYQPKIHLGSGRLVGAEALVRWQHPERGLLTPPHFLPYAEKTGVNRALTDYVLTRAVEELRRWHAQQLDLSMAVNVTMFDLLDPGFVERVAALLADAGIDPCRLELEITESEIMSDVAQVRSTLEGLRTHGVRVAIDDFGSGYSSLTYLKALPVDTLKIDRSFIMGMNVDPRDAAIVRTIVALAQTVGLTVVAEGIESEVVREQLRAAGCDLGQGFLFGEGAPGESVAEFARSGRTALAHLVALSA